MTAAIIRSPMDKHEMKFVPRKAVSDYRDRLYHGKVEYNHKGIPYRPINPQKIHRLHTVNLTGKQPVPDWLITALSQDFYALHGRAPKTIHYPGPHRCRFSRGLTVPGVGLVMVDLVGEGAEPEPYAV